MYHVKKPFASQTSICVYDQPPYSVKKPIRKPIIVVKAKLASLNFSSGVLDK
jgi:hypothetical protein